MNRRFFSHFVGASLALTLLAAAPLARASGEAPDALIKRTSTEVLDTIRSDKAIQGVISQKSLPWSTARSCRTSTSPA